MKKIKNTLAVILTVAMLITGIPFAFASTATPSDATPAADGYSITNPYADVNWETVNQYKAALHTHTNASDGDNTLIDSIERHYQTGFDIVSVTDHGTSDMSWTDSTIGSKLVAKVMGLVGKSDGNLV